MLLHVLQIGVSYNLTYVSVYVVDLKKVAPFATGGAATPHHEPSSAATSFRHGATLRKRHYTLFYLVFFPISFTEFFPTFTSTIQYLHVCVVSTLL